jgi:precorrin-2 dehydrogenase/sirohydrochlorin ferrochelatase
MKLYPVFLNIEGRLAVVVGGGEVAYRKIKDLAESGARIRIIAPVLHKGIIEFAGKNCNVVEIIEREYQNGDIEDAFIVFSSTDDPELNQRIFQEADTRGIFVNAVDDPANCTFFVPSQTRRGDLLLAVSTSGASPAMAARLRRIFEEHIPDNIEEILDSLREARIILQNNANLSSSERGVILKRIANDDEMLSKLTEYHKEKKIEEFLNSII